MSILSRNIVKSLSLGMGSVKSGKVKKFGIFGLHICLAGGDNYAIVVLWRDDM